MATSEVLVVSIEPVHSQTGIRHMFVLTDLDGRFHAEIELDAPDAYEPVMPWLDERLNDCKNRMQTTETLRFLLDWDNTTIHSEFRHGRR